MASSTSKGAGRREERTWTFLSNHGHVMLCLVADQNTSVRNLAIQVGITERAVQHILGDLEEAGMLRRIRVGRRNRYELNLDAPLRHPLEQTHSVGELLRPLIDGVPLADTG